MAFIEETKSGCCLRVHIQPKASRTEVVGPHGDLLKIRIKAPPIDGKANDEIVRFLSDLFSVPKKYIEITHGLSGRQKTITIYGISKSMAEEKLIP